MRKKKDGFTLYFDDNKNEKHHSRFITVFLAILLFVAVFIPIFGDTLRYQASYIFQEIFNMVGSFVKLFGILLIAYGFLSILLRGRINIGTLIFGVVLLWIGSFLTFTPFTFFGIMIGEALPPIGYH